MCEVTVYQCEALAMMSNMAKEWGKVIFSVTWLLLVQQGVGQSADVGMMKKHLQDYFLRVRHHATNLEYKTRAMEFIRDEFRSYGLETHIHIFDTTLEGTHGINIIGILKGKHFNTDKDKIIGISAHYDTVRDSPGANADGSGVVVLLEAARLISKKPMRDNTVMFVCFDIEEREQSLPSIASNSSSYPCGSTAFLNDWTKEFWTKLPAMYGFVNLDSVFNFNETEGSQESPISLQILELVFPKAVASLKSDSWQGDFIAVIGRQYESELNNGFIKSWKAIGKSQYEMENWMLTFLTEPAVTLNERTTYRALMRSDHASFWVAGLPAIWVTDTVEFRGYMKHCYQKACDDTDHVTDEMFQFAGKISEALAMTVDTFAPMTAPTSTLKPECPAKPVKPRPKADVDMAWMRKILEDYFSKPRHHVTNPAYKKRAMEFVRDEFRSYGLETHTQVFNTILEGTKGVNVIGVLKGKNFNTPEDKIIGISAHYDTMRNTSGVDDDGSGMTIMLQAAKILAQEEMRNNTVIFVGFDFEEWENNVPDIACGSDKTRLCGSTALVESWIKYFWTKIPQMSGIINMDTVFGFNETEQSQTVAIPKSALQQLFPKVAQNVESDGFQGDFLALIGRQYDSALINSLTESWKGSGKKKYEIEVFKLALIKNSTITPAEVQQYSDFMRSDHATLWFAGIPAVFLTDTANYRGYMRECYHRFCDDIDHVTGEMMEMAVKISRALILTVNKMAKPNNVPKTTPQQTTCSGTHFTISVAALMTVAGLYIARKF